MIEMSPEVATLIMLGGVLVGVMIGYPLAIPIGALGLILGYLLFGASVFDLLYQRLFNTFYSYVLLAVPLFVLMGLVLQRSGIAENMYNAFYLLFGKARGGLAMVTVITGAIIAACVGVITASVTMLSLLALPSMIPRGYNKSLASGVVCAAGSLGTLIPPSILLVIYGPMAQISVGKLFMGAFIPGFILSAIYITYIGVRCSLQPSLAPVITSEEMTFSVFRKATTILLALVPPGFIILAVLGSIFTGVAPPTEAAAIGAFASMLLAIAYRRFNFTVLKQVLISTLQVTSQVLLIAGLSVAFTGVFLNAGGGDVVAEFILGAPGGRWGAFVVIHIIIFILGFFIDILGIIFIMVPIVAPLATTLGFDPVWFGIMIMLNFQTAYMTPPFAPSIFILRGTAPPELGITTGDIIRGVIPFTVLVLVVLVLCTVFPDLILWLPGQMIR